MPVPSSGQLRLRADINLEINGNDTDTNVSLGTLSNDAGFTEPDQMSDFYGYANVTAPSVSVTNSNVTTSSIRIIGTLTDNGNESISTSNMRIYFGTNSSHLSNPQYTVTLNSGTSGASGSTYRRDFSGLSAGTTYYYAFKATNSVATATATGARTLPLPVNGASVSNISCGADCGVQVSQPYSSAYTLYFSGSATYNHGAASTSTVKVQGYNGTNYNNYQNNFSSTQSFNIGTRYWTFGPCYCGAATVYWYVTASGYQSNLGEWCEICVSLPATGTCKC